MSSKYMTTKQETVYECVITLAEEDSLGHNEGGGFQYRAFGKGATAEDAESECRTQFEMLSARVRDMQTCLKKEIQSD